jgi:prepilin-type N-terminal cleavage/methylation domain-containing protein
MNTNVPASDRDEAAPVLPTIGESTASSAAGRKLSRVPEGPGIPPSRRFTKGFTLMEMLLVLGVIALLIGMDTYLMVDVTGDAEEAKARADIKTLELSLGLPHRVYGASRS